ncbi:type III polyketide synthase [Bacillus horti]|uniref:Alkylresorcinol/alkylpyrone synthase n=1 Tax=Caldalkalibacillus horti TaxID=77523 RepID=A0ABT9W2M2_9BACI|nr:3-oxoacyl-[acyl-carrier-protein] synthase III C-terminal domain-containing protein [Bacillus horti]MDQ0167375.1 alkylresorcinol/alkylpyrone synthase [Bacillus horti]
MPKILSVATQNPTYEYEQEETLALAKELFQDAFEDLDRLLKVFHNGQIERRYLSVPLEWFSGSEKGMKDKNDRYVKLATDLGVACIEDCLQSTEYLKEKIQYDEIDAIFFISSSGLSTPSIEARIMNRLSFQPQTKRIPMWGLGCAGGASGLARAYDYCLAYPNAKVLVLCVELCSLTFLHNDFSKSNLIGSSLFADGVGCVLLVGDKVQTEALQNKDKLPHILGTQSNLMPNSEDVMGWNVVDEGMQVVFSKDIPSIVSTWLKPVVDEFLLKYKLSPSAIKHFIAHPGGKKVLEAYKKALYFDDEMIYDSLEVLKHFGNMSAATVLFVLDRFMKKDIQQTEKGLITALGPGFSSELLLVEWKGREQAI